MKIIEYKIASGNDYPSMYDDVKYLIDDGWQPIGGCYVDSIHGNYPSKTFYQAMVKYEEDPRDTLQLNPSTLNHWVSSAGDNTNRKI